MVLGTWVFSSWVLQPLQAKGMLCYFCRWYWGMFHGDFQIALEVVYFDSKPAWLVIRRRTKGSCGSGKLVLSRWSHQEPTILRLVCTFCWSWYAGESNSELLWNPLGLKGLKKERFPFVLECHHAMSVLQWAVSHYTPPARVFFISSFSWFLRFLVIKISHDRTLQTCWRSHQDWKIWKAQIEETRIW